MNIIAWGPQVRIFMCGHLLESDVNSRIQLILENFDLSLGEALLLDCDGNKQQLFRRLSCNAQCVKHNV